MKPNRKINDAGEVERLLMQYMGVFPDQIKEYGETLRRRINKPQKNYSK